MPGRSGRPSTCCCGCSRCGRAARACSTGTGRSAGPACSGTSASARRRAPARSAPDEHREIVDDFVAFLSGQTASYVRRLEREMRAAAAELEYERAARIRDDLARAEQGAGEERGGARRRHRHRRGRAGRGPARGRGADLLRARRPGPRAARLDRRQGRRYRGCGRAGRAVPAADVRRGVRRPIPREILVPALPADHDALAGCCPSCAARGSRSGCRNAATSGR